MRAVYRCTTDQAESAINELMVQVGHLELTSWESDDASQCTVLGPTKAQMLLVATMLKHNIELLRFENDSPIPEDLHPSFTLRHQVSSQCDVVIAHCEYIAHAFRIWQAAVSAGAPDEITHEIGARSAQMMEMLRKLRTEFGQLDATDEWMEPVYNHARDLFPIFEVVLADADEQSN